MAADDTPDLEGIEARALEPTRDLLASIFPFDPTPRTDAAGIRRLGFGRPIEKRAMPQSVAEQHLTADIAAAQASIRRRVFELVTYRPEMETRLPFLYALTDIIGGEQMAEWGRLWTALNRGDVLGATDELMGAKWDTIMGKDRANRMAVWRLVYDLNAGGTA